MLAEDGFYSLLPGVIAGFFLRRALFLGIHIEMMGLVGDQHRFMGLEILKGHGIFLGRPQICMESLGGGKAEVDGVRTGILEIFHLPDGDMAAVQNHVPGKQVFGRSRVGEILPGLFHNVGEVDEKQKVPVSLLVEIQHQPRHHQGLAAAGCHVEEHLGGLGTVSAFKMGDEVLKCLHLVGAQFKAGIEILRNIVRHRCAAAVLPQGVDFLI